MEFCQWFLLKTQDKPSFTKNVLCTDQNKHVVHKPNISHFQGADNSRFVRDRQFQNSWSFNNFWVTNNRFILCVYFYGENSMPMDM